MDILSNKKFKKSAIAAMALLLSSSVANAADLFDREGGSMKDDAEVTHDRDISVSASAAFTSQYITDGLRETSGNPTVQAGIELGYKQFYLGVWGSGIDYDNDTSHIEIDVYGGFKHKIDKFEFDIGFIYYGYPDADDAGGEFDFIEGKLAVNTDLTDKINVGAALFYTPEVFGEAGEVWSYEGTISVALGKYDRFSPTFSAKVGYLDFQDDSSLSYTYWNAGVEIGIGDKLALDLRYWDTDVDNNPAFADDEFVATLTASF
jgi:uncharacterized protein (TIGR02001 family)